MSRVDEYIKAANLAREIAIRPFVAKRSGSYGSVNISESGDLTARDLRLSKEEALSLGHWILENYGDVVIED